MEVSSRRIEDVRLIEINGRVDHTTAKAFEDALTPYLEVDPDGNASKILMDFGQLEFMTSAGLRVLMIAAKTCDRQQRVIAVADLQPLIQEIFKISRFDLILKVFPDVRTALDEMSPGAAAAYAGR